MDPNPPGGRRARVMMSVMSYASRVRRRPGERLQAWVLTGPLGHLWSALADMTLIWVRYLAHRARRG